MWAGLEGVVCTTALLQRMAGEYSAVSTEDRQDGNIQQATVNPKRLSHLPFLRYTTLVYLLVAIDSLLSISLWITGGNSKYLESNVETFSIYKSTFDLTCLAAVRGPLLISCIYYLEYYTLAAVSTKFRSRQLTSRRLAHICRAVFLFVGVISLIYSLVKGVLILLKGSEADLHITYKILCVVGVVSPALEIILGLCSFYFMRRLIRVSRLRLILNENESVPTKKNVDLKRLIKLARPVRKENRNPRYFPLIRNTLFCFLV